LEILFLKSRREMRLRLDFVYNIGEYLVEFQENNSRFRLFS